MSVLRDYKGALAQAPLDFFRGFFDMVVTGRQDYPDMTKALLCKT